MPEQGEIEDALADAVNDHDLEALIRCYSPRAVTVMPGGVAEGRDQIRSYYAQFLEAFPDLRVTIWSRLERSDDISHEWAFAATHTGPFLVPGAVLPPTGREIRVRACSVRTVEDGLILSHRLYFDQLELLSQLGVGLDLQGR
ncbi:ester cyclase [Streptosporangium sp. NPDC002524]|uniref:ester cyclase n=1 Tax=Streptosporangium sp. NPDC002524 TaxID=3154537 RepID=UPI0033173B1B